MKSSGRFVDLRTLVQYSDRILKTSEVRDWDGAVNGLQVENSGTVHRIAASVDASLATLRMAKAAEADLLIVHHGLFWSPSHPWTGTRYAAIRLLLDSDLAVYSSHLPLDLHPSVGNNAVLASKLGLRKLRPFFFEKGQNLGLCATMSISRSTLHQRLTQVLGSTPKLLPFGPATCRRIGVVTGGAGAELRKAYQEGIDTFITGEGPHWTFPLAEELGVNVFYGGHYATEVFGVQALAKHLSKRFRIPWVFLDHPSGL